MATNEELFHRCVWFNLSTRDGYNRWGPYRNRSIRNSPGFDYKPFFEVDARIYWLSFKDLYLDEFKLKEKCALLILQDRGVL